ncbi:hypothetical protein [Dyadobacter sp.]|uniref:hypothetical protein n=1 Tax=Dyadobacter sp. TaxID=1914288 RepID=UPI003F6FBA5C
MKRLLYFTLFLTVLISCKKDSMDAALNGIAVASPIAGKWRLSQIERASVDNRNEWEYVAASQVDTIGFREDGVVLQADGLPMCCAPKSLIINGVLMDIKPQSPIPANGICATVSCVYCPVWEITVTGNELIVSSCLKQRRKYIR